MVDHNFQSNFIFPETFKFGYPLRLCNGFGGYFVGFVHLGVPLAFINSEFLVNMNGVIFSLHTIAVLK